VKNFMKIAAAAEAQAARVIGLTSYRHEELLGEIATELAAAYAYFGRSVLHVETSPLSDENILGRSEASASGSHAGEISRISLSPGAGSGEALSEAADGFDTIVVQIPAVLQGDGKPTAAIMAFGPLCNLVFLTCRSGIITRPELVTCVEACRIAAVPLGGLIVCDHDLAAHALLEE
jgi:hypothetical protein